MNMEGPPFPEPFHLLAEGVSYVSEQAQIGIQAEGREPVQTSRSTTSEDLTAIGNHLQ